MAKPAGLSNLEVKAVRVCAPRGVRHPKNMDPAHIPLANRALQRIVDVMEEEVHSKRAKGVLQAAIEVREELCGPKVQKIELGGSLESILYASLVPPAESESLPPSSGLGNQALPPSSGLGNQAAYTAEFADELAPADPLPDSGISG